MALGGECFLMALYMAFNGEQESSTENNGI